MLAAIAIKYLVEIKKTFPKGIKGNDLFQENQ